MKDLILILDFGSQYTHLIKSRLADLGVRSTIIPGDAKINILNKNFPNQKIAGLILSGGAASVNQPKITFDSEWLNTKLPILGICYGCQLIASGLDGQVETGKTEYGPVKIKIAEQNQLLKDELTNSTVWMSHRDWVAKIPRDFKLIATSQNSPVAFADEKNKIYGVLFHPEVSHTKFGENILKNFCFEICHAKPTTKWSPEDFLREVEVNIKNIVGDSKLILGLSGGVDSLTTATILRKFLPKKQILAIYVASGLMPSETAGEVEEFCQNHDIPLLTVDKSDLFFSRLKKVTDPSQKCQTIGKTFIDVFAKTAQAQSAKIFVQGTIWSDVIESGVTKFSSQIKPHHNVAGLPKNLPFTLLEPLRELWKDQVRQIAKHLELPDWVVNKKVFPGPGFAIRVEGEVTLPKVKVVREATKIIEDILRNAGIFDNLWMAFAILVNVPSLGIKGDQRQEYQQAIVVRVIESKNSMTVNFSQQVFPYLEQISSRITNETEIGRVVYDITNKPPGTIEWQ